MDDDSWNNGTADLPVPLNGADLAEYEGPILRAVESCNSYNEGNLMLCFRKEWNPGVKEKVLSAIPSVEIRGGELMACATVCLEEPLTEAEMKALQDHLRDQFSSGWGEDFEQQEIKVKGGVISVHFWETDRFSIEMEQPAPKRPKMKLEKWDGDILSVLKRAERLLIENGQPERAKQMMEQFRTFYSLSSGVISQYVEIDLPEKKTKKAKKDRGEER